MDDVNLPEEWRDAVHLRAVGAAAATVDAAQSALRAAVQSARAAGDPWSAISVYLGVSPAEAERLYSAELVS